MGNKIIKDKYYYSNLKDMGKIIEKIKNKINKLEKYLNLVNEQSDDDYREGTLRAIELLLTEFEVNANKVKYYLQENQSDYAKLKNYVESNVEYLQYRRLYRQKIREEYHKLAEEDAKAYVACIKYETEKLKKSKEENIC